MRRLRNAVVVIASVLGFLGLVLLGDTGSSARARPPGAVPRVPLGVELASDEPAGCSAAPGQVEPGTFCSSDAGPAHRRARRPGSTRR
jgi:hypothetical protein